MNSIKTTLFLTLLTGIFIATGYFLNGTNGAFIALVLAGLMNIGMYWLSHKIVLMMRNAQPKDQATAHLMFQNMLYMGGINSLFSTHIKTEDRIKKLI